MKRFLILINLLIATICLAEENLSKKQMIVDLDSVGNHFRVLYAPAAWKAEHYGWDLDRSLDAARLEIQNLCPLSLKAYQRAMKKFLQTTHDYHVSVTFFATEESSLPFNVRRADGRYFISSINRSKLSAAVFPFLVGDELLTINDRPVEEVVQELYRSDFTISHPETDIALATYALTGRSGAKGQTVPRGPVMLKFLKKGETKPRQIEVVWAYKKENVPSPKFNNFNLWGASKKRLLQDEPLFRREYAVELPLMKRDDNQSKIGAFKGFLPTLGKRIWTVPANPFYDAYIFESETGPVGYIRIPHYIYPDEAIDVFETIIDKMQQETVALVVDQTHNYGGLYFEMMGLASMLTDQAMVTPSESVKVTQRDILMVTEWLPDMESVANDHDAQEVLGPTFFGIPVSYMMAQFFTEYFRFIIQQWDEGKTCTDPTWTYGVNAVNPHPRTRYIHPLVILIDELDFSCADFFPALFQDNKRATLFGARTAGAGGAKETFSIKNMFAFEHFTATASFARRPNGAPLEDLGVTPDVAYTITPDDLANGYSGYVAALKEVLIKITSKEAEKE